MQMKHCVQECAFTMEMCGCGGCIVYISTLQRFVAHADAEAHLVLKHRVCNLERALNTKNAKSNFLDLRRRLRVLEKVETWK